jgi:ribosomal protein S18 acetylase RimI-like enzyme
MSFGKETVEIRPAVLEDAEQLGAVHYQGWMETYTGKIPDAFLAAKSAEQSTAMFRRTHCKDTMVAVQDGQIIGFCGYGAYRGQEAESFGEIQGIYLLQAYQHRGIGQALLQAGVHALQAEGYQHIVLWVLHTNEKAITFYQKNGFSFDGHQKAADLGGRQKRLRFVYSE